MPNWPLTFTCLTFDSTVSIRKLTVQDFWKRLSEILQFVAHPNCQQLLSAIFYEGLPGFRDRHIVTKVCSDGFLTSWLLDQRLSFLIYKNCAEFKFLQKISDQFYGVTSFYYYLWKVYLKEKLWLVKFEKIHILKEISDLDHFWNIYSFANISYHLSYRAQIIIWRIRSPTIHQIFVPFNILLFFYLLVFFSFPFKIRTWKI